MISKFDDVKLMGSLINSDLKIKEITSRDEDIPLTDRFTISGGSLPAARNLFIRLTLQNGVVGFGECAQAFQGR